MSTETANAIVARLIEGGLDEKFARILLALVGQPPLKASEIGKLVSISRMDAYNSLKKLNQMGLVLATLDKPMRFTGLPVADVFKQLIKKEEANVRRLRQHLEEINDDSVIINSNLYSRPNEALFSVIKDRHSIYGTIENLVQESEERVWMMLSKWGILHLMRSGIMSSIMDSLDRGVEFRILADVDSKTIRFFDKLDKRIEIRHLRNQAQIGVYVDEEVGIQIVNSESNPTGRGKEDTALMIESKDYMLAQIELLKVQWNEGVDFNSTKARIVDGMITEPLKLNIGEGSFYERLQRIIGNDSGAGFTNSVLRRPGEPLTLGISAASLRELGVDMSDILRSVGHRIGQELALEYRNEDNDEKFWYSLAHKWEKLGMGKLEIDAIPPKVATVYGSKSSERDPRLGSVLCHMDEGVLEGILNERYGFQAIASEQLCTARGQDHCLFEITINNTNQHTD